MSFDNFFRSRVVDFIHLRRTQVATSKIFQISIGTICRWLAAHKTTGKGNAGSSYKLSVQRTFRKIDIYKLRSYIHKHPQAFLREIAAEFGCSSSGF